MSEISVSGHYRQSPKGRPVWVQGYSRSMGIAARKRSSLTGGFFPTVQTPGWELIYDRRVDGHRLAMTDPVYTEWESRAESLTREALQTNGDTESRYKINNTWSKGRQAQQAKVVRSILSRAEKTPREGQAILTGGLTGSGKSSLRDQHIRLSSFFVVDSDLVKDEMIRQGLAPDIEYLTPFESAGLIHRESSELSDQIMQSLAVQGTNVILDGTMASLEYVRTDVDLLHESGYSVTGLFVQVTFATARRRATARHRRGVEDFLARGTGLGGRYVPSEVLTRCDNQQNFFDMAGSFDAWGFYVNETDDQSPTLTASHGLEGGWL